MCKHHWLLETPNGPIVKGICKKCGKDKNFPSSTSDWINDDFKRGRA